MVNFMAAQSLNETEALVRKAARGAGWAWGLAEEWGYAAKWLAARELPIFLSPALVRPALSPAAVSNPISADGALCPLMTGLFLMDNQRHFHNGVMIKNLSYPLLSLPFVSLLGPMRLQWAGTNIAVGAGKHWLAQSDTLTAAVADATILPIIGTLPADGITPRDCGCPQNAEEWRRLETLAAKTFVAATADSRSHGAGAGLRDDN